MVNILRRRRRKAQNVKVQPDTEEDFNGSHNINTNANINTNGMEYEGDSPHAEPATVSDDEMDVEPSDVPDVAVISESSSFEDGDLPSLTPKGSNLSQSHSHSQPSGPKGGRLINGQRTTTRPLSPPSLAGLPSHSSDADHANNATAAHNSPNTPGTATTTATATTAATATRNGIDHASDNNINNDNYDFNFPHTEIEGDDMPDDELMSRSPRRRLMDDRSKQDDETYVSGDSSGYRAMAGGLPDSDGLCESTINAFQNICNGSTAQTTSPARAARPSLGDPEEDEDIHRESRYKLPASATMDVPLGAEEQTAIEVEYVDPRGLAPNNAEPAIQAPAGFTPQRKNAYLAAMAQKAREDYSKSNAATGKSRSAASSPPEATPFAASTIAGSSGFPSVDEEEAAMQENLYGTFSAAEKRKFLRLINSGLTPANSTQQVIDERQHGVEEDPLSPRSDYGMSSPRSLASNKKEQAPHVQRHLQLPSMEPELTKSPRSAADDKQKPSSEFAPSGITYYDAVRKERSFDVSAEEEDEDQQTKKPRKGLLGIFGRGRTEEKKNDFAPLQEQASEDSLDNVMGKPVSPRPNDEQTTTISHPVSPLTPSTPSKLDKDNDNDNANADADNKNDDGMDTDDDIGDFDGAGLEMPALREPPPSPPSASPPLSSEEKEDESDHAEEDESYGEVDGRVANDPAPVSRSTAQQPAVMVTPDEKVASPAMQSADAFLARVAAEETQPIGMPKSPAQQQQQQSRHKEELGTAQVELESKLDLDIETYMNSTDMFSTMGGSTVGGGGRTIRSSDQSVMSYRTTGTAMTTNTVSTRVRRPGAAKTRMASTRSVSAATKPTDAPVVRKKTGWHETMKAAAANTNRQWYPQLGWVDYTNPDDTLTSQPVDPPSTEKLHINLDLKSKRTREAELARQQQEEEEQAEAVEVPFPANWAKERSEMLLPTQARLQAAIKANGGSMEQARSVNTSVASRSVASRSVIISSNENDPLSPFTPEELKMLPEEELPVPLLQRPLTPQRSHAHHARRVPPQRRTIESSQRSPSRNRGWVESMKAATANLKSENGAKWDPDLGWLGLQKEENETVDLGMGAVLAPQTEPEPAQSQSRTLLRPIPMRADKAHTQPPQAMEQAPMKPRELYQDQNRDQRQHELKSVKSIESSDPVLATRSYDFGMQMDAEPQSHTELVQPPVEQQQQQRMDPPADVAPTETVAAEAAAASAATALAEKEIVSPKQFLLDNKEDVIMAVPHTRQQAGADAFEELSSFQKTESVVNSERKLSNPLTGHSHRSGGSGLSSDRKKDGVSRYIQIGDTGSVKSHYHVEGKDVTHDIKQQRKQESATFDAFANKTRGAPTRLEQLDERSELSSVMVDVVKEKVDPDEAGMFSTSGASKGKKASRSNGAAGQPVPSSNNSFDNGTDFSWDNDSFLTANVEPSSTKEQAKTALSPSQGTPQSPLLNGGSRSERRKSRSKTTMSVKEPVMNLGNGKSFDTTSTTSRSIPLLRGPKRDTSPIRKQPKEISATNIQQRQQQKPVVDVEAAATSQVLMMARQNPPPPPPAAPLRPEQPQGRAPPPQQEQRMGRSAPTHGHADDDAKTHHSNASSVVKLRAQQWELRATNSNDEADKLEPEIAEIAGTTEWKSFLLKKAQKDTAALGPGQQQSATGLNAEKLKQLHQSTQGPRKSKDNDSIFDFAVGKTPTQTTRGMPMKAPAHDKAPDEAFEAVSDISPIKVREEYETVASESSTGQPGVTSSLLQRLQACAGPILPRSINNNEDPNCNSVPMAHLAFLRTNPATSNSYSSGQNLAPPNFCGRPDVIIEGDEDDDERYNDSNDDETDDDTEMDSRISAQLRAREKRSASRSRSRPRAGSPRKASSDISSVISEEMGGTTAYIERIAMKAAVSGSGSKKSRRRAAPPSDVGSATSSQHSEKWQQFLDRKAASGRSISGSRSSTHSVSKAAKIYTSGKVDEMMNRMRSKSAPRTRPEDKTGAFPSAPAQGAPQRQPDVQSKRLDTARKAEDLAAIRLDSMMYAMSTTHVDNQAEI